VLDVPLSGVKVTESETVRCPALRRAFLAAAEGTILIRTDPAALSLSVVTP
jgi:hypothetical protein